MKEKNKVLLYIMSLLVHLLICLFILIIVYQIFAEYFVREGLENGTYQNYDTKDPNNAMILIQKNSGNIEVLKQQLDGLMGLNKEVQDISGNVAILQTQVDGLVQAQVDFASQNSPSSTPEITGL